MVVGDVYAFLQAKAGERTVAQFAAPVTQLSRHVKAHVDQYETRRSNVFNHMGLWVAAGFHYPNIGNR
jgi:hypothetical protein